MNNVRNNFGGTGLGDTDWDNDVDIVDLNNVRNYFGANFSTFRDLPGEMMMMSSGGPSEYGEAVLRAVLRNLYRDYIESPSKSSPYDELFGWDLLGDADWWKVTLGEN